MGSENRTPTAMGSENRTVGSLLLATSVGCRRLLRRCHCPGESADRRWVYVYSLPLHRRACSVRCPALIFCSRSERPVDARARASSVLLLAPLRVAAVPLLPLLVPPGPRGERTGLKSYLY